MALSVGRRGALGGVIAAGLPVPGVNRASAQRGSTIRLGVLTELSGPNSAATGQGSVLATRMAVQDFMRANPGLAVEVVDADHQTKPDLAVSIAREWLDRGGVDCITCLNNSAVALAVAGLVRERDRVALLTGPASSDLTGKACSPNHVHWTYDTWSLGNGTGRALVAEGGDTWFFIAADYTFGRLLAGDTAHFVTAAGGRVLGTAYTPFPETTDFSSFLLRAQASGVKVIGLANSGTNTINCVKQAAEFGLTARGARLAALLMMITDVHSLGLSTARGLALTEAFYWDLNDGTRAFSRRFAPQAGDRMPSMVQAGDYSAALHYLKAVQALGAKRAKASGRAFHRQIVARLYAKPPDR